MQLIRIGILLDDVTVPLWVHEFLEWLQQEKSFHLCVVVLNSGPHPATRSSFFYRSLRRVDQQLFQLPKNPSARVVWNPKDVKVVKAVPIRKKFSDYIPEPVLDQIREQQPDLLIRFGFRILRGKILSVAPYGILSLHHGDTATYRGGPPAFWEVVEQAPVTGVSLQVLTEELDAGLVVAKTFLRTDITSFYRNQQKIYWAGLQLLKDQLQQLSKRGIALYLKEQHWVYQGEPKGKLYRNPNNLKSVQLFFQFLLRTLQRRWYAFRYAEQWQIQLKPKARTGYLNIEPNASQKQLIPPKDRIWADPCLVVHNGQRFLFLEEKLNRQPHAHIAVLRLDANGNLIHTVPEKVLEEPFHLSYPQVFQWHERFFMIPESGDARTVRLYESTAFPTGWKPVRELLNGSCFYDATVFHYEDGNWYLFCTQKADACYSSDSELYIYFTDDLLNGTFQPHPQNPLRSDVRGARPAGPVFKENGTWIRPAQCSAPRYGYGIYFYEILELSPTRYSEIQRSVLMPDDTSKVLGTHTFQRTDGLQITDQQVRRRRYFS